jgi:hypothetical protein
VKSVLDFGAIVDIGAQSHGLLHISCICKDFPMTQGDFHLGFTLQTLADKGVHVSFHKMLIYEGVVGFHGI